MKTVIFDLEAIGNKHQESDSGMDIEFLSIRPHFTTLLKYLAENKIHVYLCGELKSLPAGILDYVTGVFAPENNPPRQPDVFITTNPDRNRKFPSTIVIPPYTRQFNEFASLSLAGALLDTLKNRVVLGKQAKETEKVKDKQSTENHEDVTNYGFSI